MSDDLLHGQSGSATRLIHHLGDEGFARTFCGRSTASVKSWAFPWVTRELGVANICANCQRSARRRAADPKAHDFPLPGGDDA